MTDPRNWTGIKHGTISGFTRHQKLGETPCDPCKAAKSAYDKERRSSGNGQELNRLRAKAQREAFSALAEENPERYAALYEHFKQELGVNELIPPKKTTKKGK